MRDYVQTVAVDNKWVARGFGNIEFYDRQWEYGNFCIEKRPSYCDRGAWALKTDIHGFASYFLPFQSQYFVSFDAALAEANDWIERIRQYSLKADKTESINWRLAASFINRDVRLNFSRSVSSQRFMVDAIAISNPPIIDSQDGFLRYYLSEAIAREEIEGWLKHRKLDGVTSKHFFDWSVV